MICGNSFDQKFGELHDSSWNNSRFDVIKLTDELRELDGRIIDCIYKDNQWVFQRLRHDRKSPNNRKAAESNNKQRFLNVSITLNYLSLIDLFTWHRQFGNVEGPDNTHSSVDVFEDCHKLRHIIVDTWTKIKQIQNSTHNSFKDLFVFNMQFPIRWRKLILTNGWTLEPINCLPEEVPLADDIKDWKSE